ncbi:hypothetical protein D1007_07178 [Hordeum vulgare]|nr:hypothetical protein D1007_07178 [Hordeum vulgare]
MMDPSEILHVCFHLGGDFLRIGPNLQYVGGDDVMSDIEMDKLSLQEVKGFLKDHIALKESMKFYFLIPGEELVNGLIFLNDDSKCVQMADYVDVAREPAESDTYLLITDETGVVTEVISSPQKHRTSSGKPHKHTVAARHDNVAAGHDVAAAGHDNVSQGPLSQVLDPTQHIVATGHNVVAAEHDSASDSDSDFVYIPQSDDNGEDSKVVELRRHVRKFKKRMRDSKSWIGSDATSAVPIDLIANMEQQIAA